MATVAMQKDLVVAFKKETILNVGILSKVQPMSNELSRQIFKDNALEKPTQNLFNHLTHYLVSIIDSQVASSISWPLYDTKTEKAYRNELSSFIADYSSKGLLSLVMSSYLVNPGCYKVTLLLFQMSQLAVQRVLLTKMKKDKQIKLYTNMTAKYKAQDKEDFMICVEKETVTLLSRFSNYLIKRNIMEKIAEMFKKKIIEMEATLTNLNTERYINELIDTFFKKYHVDEVTKAEIMNIKNIYKPSKFFDAWLEEFDQRVDSMESEWNKKMTPFLELSKETQNNTQLLIARQTGEADRSTYTLEYNPKTDNIDTKDLESYVNSEQKYILRNIIKDDKLIFPNLVRGFLIAISFILKDTEICDEVDKFNKYLEGGRQKYKELAAEYKILLDRVMNAQARLQVLLYKEYSEYSTDNDNDSEQETPSSKRSLPHNNPPRVSNLSVNIQNFTAIPPMPDLSDLKTTKEFHTQLAFDTFTPLNISKHQFNLRRKTSSAFAKPQPRSLLITPFYQRPKDDFLKSLISCRESSYDCPNVTQNFVNNSILNQTNIRNETKAGCTSGFTKEQILRLLSTKKSSSSKKFKYKTERPDNVKVKKRGLFNDSHVSQASNDSIVGIGLIRSHSSPNLYENRPAKRSKIPRKLSVMQEDYALMEVSGISTLEKENSYGTPDSVVNLEKSRKLLDATSLPIIVITPEVERDFNNHADQNVHFADLNFLKLQENVIDKDELKTETPKNNLQLIRKTSSLEKIINRFKKVRASVLPTEKADSNEFRTIAEEKEHLNSVNVDVFTANRVLLPDLLSPSCSVIKKSTDYLDDDLCVDMKDVGSRKPRESLGTALGVDHTFLDQFDLID